MRIVEADADRLHIGLTHLEPMASAETLNE